MDGRGRLAQPLKRTRQSRESAARCRRAAPARARIGWPVASGASTPLAAAISSTLARPARRRHRGIAALLLLASGLYGVVKGSHMPASIAALRDTSDSAANSVGFRISELALAGQHEVSRADILALAGITGSSSLLFLDAGKRRPSADQSVDREAAVLKLYPDRLRIEIKERKAFALWQKEGRVYLIADDGTVLETYVTQRFASLPLVVGDGAEHRAQEFLDLLKRYPAIAKSVEASVLVAERRWNLHLKSGLEVLLPRANPKARYSNWPISTATKNCFRAISSPSICDCRIA